MPSLRRLLPLAAVTLAAVFVPGLVDTAAAGSTPRHFELRASVPAEDTVLSAAPERVQLWFTQEPQLEGARIRIVDAGGDQVEMGPTAPVPDTATSLRAEVRGSMAPGAYVIHWRAMARDGHLVTGEIPFEVAAAPLR